MMNYWFIEDTHECKVTRGKTSQKHSSLTTSSKTTRTRMKLTIKIQVERTKGSREIMRLTSTNIMAKERRVDLLQHPLCLAITLKKCKARRFTSSTLVSTPSSSWLSTFSSSQVTLPLIDYTTVVAKAMTKKRNVETIGWHTSTNIFTFFWCF